jgi:GntR family transcriptional regulator/MocR family aminotransferase
MMGVDAGLHVVLELPGGLSEDEALARGQRRNLTLEGLTSFAHAAPPYRPSLVVGYATPPAHAFTTAVARLCAGLASGS